MYILTSHGKIDNEVITVVDKNDIIYIQISDRRIVIHTLEEPHIGSLNEQLEIILGCFGFERADQNKFVQVNKILNRDKKLRRLYFNRERTKFCQVTRPHLHKFFWKSL